MKHQAVPLRGISSFRMEKACSLFKENYLHFFCIWLKLLGLVQAKLWEGDPGARVDCIWRALASLLWGNRRAWPGQETPFGCRCTDTFSLSLALFSPELQIPGAFWGLLVAIVSWWLWAGAYTQPWGQVVWSRGRCVFLQLRGLLWSNSPLGYLESDWKESERKGICGSSCKCEELS